MKRSLEIFYTSDLHGSFFPMDYATNQKMPQGLFSYVKYMQKNEDNLLIDGGDLLQGSPLAAYLKQTENGGHIFAQIMNNVGYGFYTLGNHDFNFGIDYLKQYMDEVHAVCVCANLMDETKRLPIFPWHIKTMPNQIRVGITGLVTDWILKWEREENRTGISVIDPVEAAKNALKTLKGSCDLTICIYHGGLEKDIHTGELISLTTEHRAAKLCKECDFDILLTGHQHRLIPMYHMNHTHLVQPTDKGKAAISLSVTFMDSNKSIYSEALHPDSDTENILTQKWSFLENDVQKWLDIPIGKLKKPCKCESHLEMALNGSALADWINKIQIQYTNAQISCTSLPNELTDLPQEVTRRNILAVYPYENTLFVLEVTGKTLKKALERSAEYVDVEENGGYRIAESFLEPKTEHYLYDYFYGIEIKRDFTKPHGKRITSIIYQGKKVSDTDTFTLCMTNYRASGSGGYECYQDCKVIQDTRKGVFELLLETVRGK